MADARIIHPDRSNLPFRQRQLNEDQTTANVSVNQELGERGKPEVHTEGRARTIPIRGLATGTKQNLAFYADRLESHVDEFQGDGYTFQDDILDVSKNVIVESIEWSLTPGKTDSLRYNTTLQVGRGAFDSKPTTRRYPTYDQSMVPMLRVDGVDLTGMRDYRLNRSIGVETKAVINRDSAETNDVLATEGAQTAVVFEGTLTGDKSTRKTKDQTLRDKNATSKPITLETKFPGYDLEGYVTAYESRQRSDMGVERHDFRIEFIEGIKA